MPIATPEIYREMLDRAKKEGFAYPAINVSSSQTLNAAIRGFAEAGSDGIIQVSTGGAEYFSGPTQKNMVAGALAMAAFAREVAKQYDVNIALHTDHCPKDKLDGFVRPLLEASIENVKNGGEPFFQSHMWDGSAVPLEENLEIAQELLAKCKEANIILEIEVGVVGGEEDGVANEINEQLYSTPEDAIATAQALGAGTDVYYMTALTFGNVHGVYKPGNVKLRPSVLKDAQDAVKAKFSEAEDKPFHLVFHGGSGSSPEEIAEAVDNPPQTTRARLRGDGALESPELAALTEQEKRVLDLITQGYTNRQIAGRLHLAEKTVKNYVTSLLAKLGLESRTQAAVLMERLRHPH